MRLRWLPLPILFAFGVLGVAGCLFGPKQDDPHQDSPGSDASDFDSAAGDSAPRDTSAGLDSSGDGHPGSDSAFDEGGHETSDAPDAPDAPGDGDADATDDGIVGDAGVAE